jgi:hypothetical protein
MAPPILRDGPGDARATIVLAHGAGAGMEHPFLEAVAKGLAAAGFAVVRFQFPWLQQSRVGPRAAPDRLPVLQAAMREVVASHAPAPFVLAGKSLGGRVATTIADGLGASATIVFSYPFHPPREPGRLRTAHLAALRTPTLILQGERDPFGTRDEVRDYELSTAIEICWLPDGDHSLVPRKRSGFTAEQHLATAIARAAEFARR